MLLIPAIDLKDGRCVRLRQGRMEDSTIFSDDPVAMAGRWVEAGARRLHLVDLNGAFAGQPVTLVGEGQRKHSFVAARDVVAFALAAIGNPAAARWARIWWRNPFRIAASTSCHGP